MKDNGSGADFGAFADSERAEHLSAAGYDDAIFYGRMAFAFFLSRTAERHALVEGNVVADNRRFTDDDTRTVVDEQSGTNLCARMNFNSCKEAGNAGNKASRNEPFVKIEKMRESMCPNSV